MYSFHYIHISATMDYQFIQIRLSKIDSIFVNTKIAIQIQNKIVQRRKRIIMKRFPRITLNILFVFYLGKKLKVDIPLKKKSVHI